MFSLLKAKVRKSPPGACNARTRKKEEKKTGFFCAKLFIYNMPLPKNKNKLQSFLFTDPYYL